MKKSVLFLFLTGILIIAMRPIPTGVYKIGDKINDFKLKNVNDEWITLSDYMGEEGAIIIFTCNTCPYAKLYEDRIIEAHNTYSQKGFPVLAVNPNDPIQKPGDSFEKMKQRSSEKDFPFAYVFDAEQEIYPRFGATNTPQVFLIDNEMKLRYVGAIDDNPKNAEAVKINYVKNAIEAIKSGENPDPDHTKAIGCGIKAKKKMNN